MAKFVLAGKADCPHYAKAEHLADMLQRSLPDFRIHKICVHPNDWERWLKDTCSANGWRHKRSPIVWRELVDRGGKGMLLGGFSDFLEHAQGYYGITLDMQTEMMLKIAGENLKAKEQCMEEEIHLRDRLKPLHIWISSALNPTCYNLIPLLFSTGLFKQHPTVCLHLLDLDGCQQSLHGLQMETEDLALPQLHNITYHSTTDEAFSYAHLIVFLDDWQTRSKTEDERGDEREEDKRSVVRGIVERFRHYGQLLEENASKDVRVVVAGDSFINLKCSLLIENAPSVDPRRFVAMATQLECEARTLIAQKLCVKTTDVADVIVWGNISGSFHIDLQRATVFRYEGAIWGPAGFSQPVLHMLYDRKWLDSDFLNLISSRRGTVASKSNRSAAISATNGIIAVLRAWNNDSNHKKILSLGVLSTGQFDIPAGLVFSMPVILQAGEWSVCSDVVISKELRKRLEASIEQLREVGHRKLTLPI
ncbi:putative malate dehydrogenase 1B [Chanos chanos]|uniref:Malate dehydrogenase 1B n=1 Tax=Chanos chanos TaxID=29144 RepID=A0A6J2VUQ5_CHACN|nr:putative malate dehydrogenase 1B [Chanos chanos]